MSVVAGPFKKERALLPALAPGGEILRRPYDATADLPVADLLARRRDCVVQVADFFFSSRRRHTRSLRDWSSDVCSSDLDFLGRRYGLDLKSFGPPLVAIYVLSDVGSVIG